MTIEILSGDTATDQLSEDFAGTVNPRRLKIGENLQARATRLLSEAFGNSFGADYRLAEAFSTSDFKLAAA